MLTKVCVVVVGRDVGYVVGMDDGRVEGIEVGNCVGAVILAAKLKEALGNR
jgi:hypothetical protein